MVSWPTVSSRMQIPSYNIHCSVPYLAFFDFAFNYLISQSKKRCIYRQPNL